MTPEQTILAVVVGIFAAVGLVKCGLALIPQGSNTQPPSPPVAPSDKLASVILAYNNGHAFFATDDTYTVPAKGVVIHKITQAQANAISAAVQASAAKYGLPLTYALACLSVESVLDPLCQNGNLGPGESNTANDPMGYDDGVAQLKLRYLLAPGITDAATAQAFAFQPLCAVPYFCSLMQGKIAAATTAIAADTSSAPDVRLRNPLMYATGSYNYGDTGMQTVFASGEFPNHCVSVLSDEQYFAGKLGVPSVFANLPQ